MGSLSAQDTVDTGDVANNDAEVLAATLWITRHASELAAVASTTSHLGMTRDSLAEAAREAAVHRAGLYRQLDSLAGKGYEDQVGRMTASQPNPGNSYGLGISTDEILGLTIYTHGGGVPGFRTIAAYAPAFDLGIALTTNLLGLESDDDVGPLLESLAPILASMN